MEKNLNPTQNLFQQYRALCSTKMDLDTREKWITLLDHERRSKYRLPHWSCLLDWSSDHCHSWTDLTATCQNLEDIFIKTVLMIYSKKTAATF